MFDPQSFLSSSFTGSNDTKFQPIPAGEFLAVVDSIEPKNGTVTKEGQNYGKPWARLDIAWSILDPTVLSEMGRDKVTVRQGIMLDLTDDGSVDMGKGKNVRLGRFREAVEINSRGASLQSAIGRQAKIRVSQRPYNDGIQNDVDGVTKVGFATQW